MTAIKYLDRSGEAVGLGDLVTCEIPGEFGSFEGEAEILALQKNGKLKLRAEDTFKSVVFRLHPSNVDLHQRALS